MTDDESQEALPRAISSGDFLIADMKSRSIVAGESQRISERVASWGQGERELSPSLVNAQEQYGTSTRTLVTFADDLPSGRRSAAEDNRSASCNDEIAPRGAVVTVPDPGSQKESKDKKFNDRVATHQNRSLQQFDYKQ